MRGSDSASSRFADEWYEGVKLIKSDTASGYMGVKASADGKKFVAAYAHQHLGTFDTAQKASFAYSKAKVAGDEAAKAAAKVMAEAKVAAEKIKADAKEAAKAAVNSPLKKALAKVEKLEANLAAAKLDLAAEMDKLAVADADDAVPVE